MSLHNTMLNAGTINTKCSIRLGWVKWKALPGETSGWVVAYHKDLSNKKGYVPGTFYRSGGPLRDDISEVDTLFIVQSSEDLQWYVGHWHYGKYPKGFDEVAGPFKTLALAKVALELLQ